MDGEQFFREHGYYPTTYVPRFPRKSPRHQQQAPEIARYTPLPTDAARQLWEKSELKRGHERIIKERAERVLNAWQWERDSEELAAMNGKRCGKRQASVIRYQISHAYPLPTTKKKRSVLICGGCSWTLEQVDEGPRTFLRKLKASSLHHLLGFLCGHWLGGDYEPLVSFTLRVKDAYCSGCNEYHVGADMFYTERTPERPSYGFCAEWLRAQVLHQQGVTSHS